MPVSTLTLERFRELIAPSRWRRLQHGVARAGELLSGRVVWNVNSTARGGGVAELLQSLIGYARGAGVDARWVAISGDAAFFEITKRLHNRLHGNPGDGGPLGPAQRAEYEAALAAAAAELGALVGPRDLVILHDPQTAGLIPHLAPTGARIAWRSHVGCDSPNDLAREAWSFLLEYVRHANACIFSRAEYAWEGLEPARVAVIHPSIDVFSAKNKDLSPDSVLAILSAAGIIAGRRRVAAYERADGQAARVHRRAALVEDVRLRADTRVVVQVSRWDRLKDPLGVMDGFARHVPDADAHLVLAGPATAAVADDPEGQDVLREVAQARARLDADVRRRVHLASIPMDDPEETAVIVNALQRHATVVCQKSIAEGFGLTVAEAMWKSRPVVATRTGGIQDQIVDGVSGILISDPLDLASFGAAISRLLSEPATAARMGGAAHKRARARFLGPEHLMQYLALFGRMLGTADSTGRAVRPG